MWKKVSVRWTKFYWNSYFKILKLFNSDKLLFLYWYNKTQNFGDTINPLFISIISQKKIVWMNPVLGSVPYIHAIGSIIEFNAPNSIIWGSGFISEDSDLRATPLAIKAVRGPKSRQRFLDYGLECPEVYGDPALLFPRVYFPKIEKKYRLGIMPHYVEKQSLWLQNIIKSHKDIKIIDVQEEDVWKVIDDMLSCDKIASSSLHGLIVADAYGIPSSWISFSDKLHGGTFKFFDYFLSVGRTDTEALKINESTTIKEIESSFYDYKIDIDLEKLIEAAPFKVSFPENIEARPSIVEGSV